ncbi:MAG: RNA methyltransferase [Candidatus Omnitrophica bacterium]|nr:RNA methyltransferase [Candidatus Omnitrophota bacterium]
MTKKYMQLYGKNSVYERLRHNPRSIKKIFLQDNFKAPHIEALINACTLPVERVPARTLENMQRTRNVQGIVARTAPFSYSVFPDLVKAGPGRLILVFLDRINDPQNLGVIIRGLACFGGFALVIPESSACGITDAVLHVASGGENYVPVARVPDMASAVKTARNQGYWVMGAVVDAQAHDLNTIKFSFPLALVLGAETTGISEEVRKYLDARVYIPMPGAQLSLNVAMACTVFSHAIAQQRGNR